MHICNFTLCFLYSGLCFSTAQPTICKDASSRLGTSSSSSLRRHHLFRFPLNPRTRRTAPLQEEIQYDGRRLTRTALRRCRSPFPPTSQSSCILFLYDLPASEWIFIFWFLLSLNIHLRSTLPSWFLLNPNLFLHFVCCRFEAPVGLHGHPFVD